MKQWLTKVLNLMTDSTLTLIGAILCLLFSLGFYVGILVSILIYQLKD